MDKETSQTALTRILERISRLENEIRELRQLIFVQMPHLVKPIDKSLSIASNSDLSESMARTDYWEVTCLGRFRLRYAGRDLALCSSRRGQSILKYLLASPGYAASSETFLEHFWPQVDPEAGAHSLQVAVHTLRHSLRGCGPDGSDETVLFRNNRYFLNPSLSIVQDVDRFRAAYKCGLQATTAGQLAEAKQAFEEARSLYTGDYHADCYEEWASSRRLALIDTRLALLSQLGSL
jgi:DNA-binding SARP family transcriptional activator